MKVAWLTARSFGHDLCGTTQIELSIGLVKRGIDLTIYAPGTFPNERIRHVPLERSKIKGRQSASLVKRIRRYLDQINRADVVLVDWKLSKIIPKIETEVILIDRGPPADQGVFSLLQWRAWKRGWKSVKKGCVVSENHRDFVEKIAPSKGREITVLPAGVNTTLFKKSARNGPIRLVYQGRIDAHRGIDSVLDLFQSLDQTSNGFELYLHGKGDMVETIRNKNLEHVYITGHLSQSVLAQRLAEYDIGLLPMPASKIWKLASPLKRAEYLGAGLLILGIHHQGHELLKGRTEQFSLLFDQHEFHTRSKKWLESLRREDIGPLQDKARAYAEAHLDWSQSVDYLLSMISS